MEIYSCNTQRSALYWVGMMFFEINCLGITYFAKETKMVFCKIERVKRLSVFLVLLYGFLVVPTVCLAKEPASLNIYSVSKDKVVVRAEEELKKYLGQILGCNINSLKELDYEGIDASSKIFILGTLDDFNKLNDKKFKKQIGAYFRSVTLKETFLIADSNFNNIACTILASTAPQGVLYAAYHYLEEVCGVGFFEDGENIPRLDHLPSLKASILESPRFEERYYRFWPALSLKKYNCMFWKSDDWHQNLDWLAKKRINRQWVWAYREDLPFGTVFDLAFPEIGPPPEEEVQLMGQASMNWTWPLDYRRAMGREVLDYARTLGIRNELMFDYGAVPARFKEAHPEMDYLLDPYGPESAKITVFLDPTKKVTGEIYGKFIRKLIEVYGTDHLYRFEPFGESGAGLSPDEAFLLKVNTGVNAYKYIWEIDPYAQWVQGGWDFIVLGKVWTPDNMKKYLTGIAPAGLYIAEAAMEQMDYDELLYKRNNYYHGRKWGLGTLSALGGFVSLHGKFDEMIRRFKDIANDPKAVNCTGVFHESESGGHNILMYELYFALSWNPESFDREEFLRNFCLRRYGKDAYPVMRQVTDIIIDAVLTNGDWNPPCYQQTFLYSEDNRFDAKGFVLSAQKFVPKLRDAISKMLRLKGSLGENPMFRNDLTQYFIALNNEVVNHHFAKAYLAFRAKDWESFDLYAAKGIKTMKCVEKVLSANKNYYLQNTIDAAMSVKGAHRRTPEMVRRGVVFSNYMSSPIYELYSNYFFPRAQTYIDYLSADRNENRQNREEKLASKLQQSGYKAGEEFIQKDLSQKQYPCESLDLANVVEEVLSEMTVPLDKPDLDLSRPFASEINSKNNENGIYLITNIQHTGRIPIVTANGRSCGHPGGYAYQNNKRFAHFDVDERLAERFKNKKLIVEVDYCDKTGSLFVEYDSLDSALGATEPVYKHTDSIVMQNTGEWKTATFVIENPRFGNRQHIGADFRVTVNQREQLYVSKVSLRLLNDDTIPITPFIQY